MSLKKSNSKVSLNIKITPELDARLKTARANARKNGLIFNVSELVEKQLIKELKKVEKQIDENKLITKNKQTDIDLG